MGKKPWNSLISHGILSILASGFFSLFSPFSPKSHSSNDLATKLGNSRKYHGKVIGNMFAKFVGTLTSDKS